MKLVQLRTSHDQASPAPQLHRQDRLLCHLSLSDRTATSCDLKRELEDATGSQISCRTVRRKLLKCGLKGCIAARKPLRSAVHRKKRLEWCQQRKDWTPEQWKKIIIILRRVHFLTHSWSTCICKEKKGSIMIVLCPLLNTVGRRCRYGGVWERAESVHLKL